MWVFLSDKSKHSSYAYELPCLTFVFCRRDRERHTSCGEVVPGLIRRSVINKGWLETGDDEGNQCMKRPQLLRISGCKQLKDKVHVISGTLQLWRAFSVTVEFGLSLKRNLWPSCRRYWIPFLGGRYKFRCWHPKWALDLKLAFCWCNSGFWRKRSEWFWHWKKWTASSWQGTSTESRWGMVGMVYLRRSLSSVGKWDCPMPPW